MNGEGRERLEWDMSPAGGKVFLRFVVMAAGSFKIRTEGKIRGRVEIENWRNHSRDDVLQKFFLPE